jgi:hypothetical protein
MTPDTKQHGILPTTTRNFSWQYWIYFISLLTPCNARVSALTIVKESENGRLVWFWKRSVRWCAFSWRIRDKNCHIIGVSRATVSIVMSSFTNHGKPTLAKRNSGRKSTLTKEIVVHWEGLFRKFTQLLQHRWQDRRTEYSSWRFCFHKNCPTWASQIQNPR